jgi:hypothetical protein
MRVGLPVGREPGQRLLEILKGPHTPTPHSADERKQPRPAMRVGAVKYSQPVRFGEADVPECGHQHHQVPGFEHRHRAGFQRAQIEEGLMSPAFAARARQIREDCLAGRRV